MPDNSYNQIRYRTFPEIQTHPDRLAAVGTFFGMHPAPVTGCRMLEIGCGDGGNLIPMACAIPGSRFIGVDLAEEPIAAGRRTVEALGLSNITLIHGDLRDIGSDYGEFDYIVAPGVYSWVPADVRDRLVALCAERLAPNGIAYVSYNTYPGQHARRMFREMMLYHTRNIADPGERIEQARQFLQFLDQRTLLLPAWKTFTRHEVSLLLERHPGGLFHDDLAEINDPVYFRQFAEHAARHGLQYLSEANPSEVFDQQGSLDWLGDDLMEREQYLDMLRARRFRQTLLCRQEIALRRRPVPELMPSFLFSAPCKIPEEGQIEGLRGVTLAAPHPTVQRLTEALGKAWPCPIAFDDLLPQDGNRRVLQEILLGLVTAGFADLHLFAFPCERKVTAQPTANRLARHQASESRTVVSARHQVVELDEVARQLLLLLDGTRDHEALERDLHASPGAPPEAEIRAHLPASLQWMAGMALLEG